MNIILDTYGTHDEDTDSTKVLQFVLSEEVFEELIKETGWESKEQFLNEYIYDSSLVIYEKAKAMKAIIEEVEVEPYLIPDTYKFIFVDRLYNDGWAEPYLVEVETNGQISKENLTKEIEQTIRKFEEGEGISCSIEGIQQILSQVKAVVEVNIVNKDYTFQFGRT